MTLKYRSYTFLLFLLSFALLGLSLISHKALADNNQVLQGNLIVEASTNPAGTAAPFSYFIEQATDDGINLVKINPTTKIINAKPGSLLKLTYDGNISPDKKPTTVTIIDIATPQQGNEPTGTYIGTRRTAVVMVNFSDTSLKAPTKTTVVNDTTTLSNYYTEASYNKLQMNYDVFKWYKLNIKNVCNLQTIKAATMKIADPDINYSLYNNLVIIFPSNKCGGSIGYGELGYASAITTDEGTVRIPTSIVTAQQYAAYGKATIVHEIGHNFNLMHANGWDCGTKYIGEFSNGCNSKAYMDPYDPMGFGTANTPHFSVYYKYLLGWFTSRNMLTLDSSTLTASQTFTLAPIETVSNNLQAIRIRYTNKDGNNAYYYIENRNKTGFDSYLPLSATNGILIHKDDHQNRNNGDLHFIDATPGSKADAYSDFKDGGWNLGKIFVDSKNNILIRATQNQGDNVLVEISPYVVAQPTAPINNQQLTNLRPTLTWTQGSFAAKYTIQISTAANFASLAYNKTTTDASTSHLVTQNLPKNKTLYWRVKAVGSGYNVWSTRASFVTPLPPSKPALTAPANAALLKQNTVTFKWKASAPVPASYQIQVSRNNTFTDLVKNESVLGNLLTTSLELPTAQKYFWRVRATSSAGILGDWSAARNLIVSYAVPNPISPVTGSTTVTLTPTFSWSAVTGDGLKYRLQVSNKADFSNLLVNAVVTGSTNYTMPKNLPKGKTIYWRVIAIGTYGPGAWSARQSFVTPII